VPLDEILKSGLFAEVSVECAAACASLAHTTRRIGQLSNVDDHDMTPIRAVPVAAWPIDPEAAHSRSGTEPALESGRSEYSRIERLNLSTAVQGLTAHAPRGGKSRGPCATAIRIRMRLRGPHWQGFRHWFASVSSWSFLTGNGKDFWCVNHELDRPLSRLRGGQVLSNSGSCKHSWQVVLAPIKAAPAASLAADFIGRVCRSECFRLPRPGAAPVLRRQG